MGFLGCFKIAEPVSDPVTPYLREDAPFIHVHAFRQVVFSYPDAEGVLDVFYDRAFSEIRYPVVPRIMVDMVDLEPLRVFPVVHQPSNAVTEVQLSPSTASSPNSDFTISFVPRRTAKSSPSHASGVSSVPLRRHIFSYKVGDGSYFPLKITCIRVVREKFCQQFQSREIIPVVASFFHT